MSYVDIIQKLPGVASPTRNLNFKEKMKWTLLVLLSYFALSNIYLWGVSGESYIRFEQLATLLGASFGTIITLGIGPIVSASIILQLLVGSGILNWDLNTHEGKILFQGTQKLLIIVFSFVEGFAYTMFGAIPASDNSFFGISFVALQLVFGAILIMFMDEVVSKWGFGSGVSLFIAAGISKQIFIRAFSLQVSETGTFIGLIPGLIQKIVVGGGVPLKDILTTLMPVFITLVVFSMVVYAQSMRVEIPLSFGSIRGFGRKWPLKFIYTSNMPVILAAALLINLDVWGKLLSDKGIHILGTFNENGAAMSGLMFYLSPPNNFIQNLVLMNVGFIDVVRVITYTLTLIVLSVIFSVFWVNTSNMDPKSVALQIQRTGMQIPGFRRDPRVIERVLQRYIPALAVLGGGFVGFLAAFADIMGALSRGTGILLAVMIIYQFYEIIAQQQLEDAHPMLRKMFGKE